MFARLFRRLVGAALLVGLAYLATRDGAPGLIVGWALLGYLLFRAWPAVRSDFAALTAFLPQGGRRGGSSFRRIAERSGDL